MDVQEIGGPGARVPSADQYNPSDCKQCPAWHDGLGQCMAEGPAFGPGEARPRHCGRRRPASFRSRGRQARFPLFGSKRPRLDAPTAGLMRLFGGSR